MSALGFKARVDPLFAGSLTCVILRFTSGATLADCVEVSMAAKPFRSTYSQTHNVNGRLSCYLLTARETVE